MKLIKVVLLLVGLGLIIKGVETCIFARPPKSINKLSTFLFGKPWPEWAVQLERKNGLMFLALGLVIFLVALFALWF